MILDHKPLSDQEIDSRLRAALDALGNARGATPRGHRLLTSARKILAGCILALLRGTTPTVELWPATPKKPKPEARPRD